jgi:hypothetical protein
MLASRPYWTMYTKLRIAESKINLLDDAILKNMSTWHKDHGGALMFPGRY